MWNWCSATSKLPNYVNVDSFVIALSDANVSQDQITSILKSAIPNLYTRLCFRV